MGRLHVPEIEDSDFCPPLIRQALMRLLRTMSLTLRLHEAFANELASVLQRGAIERVLDLGSGDGGITPAAFTAARQRLGAPSNVTLELSDRFPDTEAVKRLQAEALEGVSYRSAPLEIDDADLDPSTVVTMVNSFHHLRPEQARALLTRIHQAGASVLICELMERPLPGWLGVACAPFVLVLNTLTALLMTARCKGVPLAQWLLTVPVPVVPLAFAWDGLASALRIYDRTELEKMTEGLADQYTWTVTRGQDSRGAAVGFFLLGVPEQPS